MSDAAPSPAREPSVWTNPVYVALFSAQAATLTGSGVSAIALGMLAFQLVGANVSEVVGIVLTIRIAARVLVSPLAGQVAGLVGTRGAMLLCDATAALGVLVFFFAQDIWHIYAGAVVLFVGDALFTPLYKATIPRVVTPTQYPKALAYSSMAYQISTIGGPAVAGLVVSTIGIRGNFLLDLATYAVSMAVVWWLPRRYFQTRAERAAAAAGGNKPRALDGLRAVFGRRMLREAFLLEWHSGISGGLILVATVDYVKTTLQGSDSAYAWVMATYGLGALAGAWLYSLGGERIHRVVIAIVPWALTAVLVAVTLAPSYLLLVACWILAGAGGVMVNVRANQYLAENSVEAEREAVYAAQFSLSHLIWGFTYPLAGFATTGLGFYGTCWLFAGLNLLLILVRKWLHTRD
ncbi:MAG: MFS transporter [Verrucomicrobiota bacterium]